MKSSRFIVGLFVIFTLFSCTLSTQQETVLNSNMNQLITVRNEGDALSYMDYTHPIIVKHYKQKGTVFFKEKFQEVSRENEQNENQSKVIFWDKGYIKSTKANDSLIQAKIQISLIQNNKPLDSSALFYAITTKNASNWTFVSRTDYFSVFPEKLRLFEE
jgi:hypothetical protein